MKEYKNRIEKYAEYNFSSFSKLVSDEKWGDKNVAEKYLNKYWLTEKEYKNKWEPIQNAIFRKGKSFPELIYNKGFKERIMKGGCLFIEEDFKVFQKIIKKIETDYFVVIQHSQEYTQGEPTFRMKFPINITWNELISGNYISAVLLEMNYNEYLVFGESANWGKYSANDYQYPVDVFGFKPTCSSLFEENLIQSQEDKDDLLEWLPKEYRELIK